MSANQRYVLQREQLTELRKFLLQFDNEMQQKLAEYKRRVQQLGEAGLPQETTNKFYSEMLPASEGYVRQNSDYIQGRAIPFVNQNIAGLEKLIEMNR